jgi:predicted PurR-regulated permease PerM
MLKLDDRTGNVLTTVAVFALVVGIAFAARATIAVFVLALLLAYLLEPAVGRIERALPPGGNSRVISIAVVYAIGILLILWAGYAIAPRVPAQMQALKATVQDLQGWFADLRIPARIADTLATVGERAARAIAAAAEDAGWLFLVPVIAPFFLINRNRLIDGAVDLLARRQDRDSMRRTVGQVDTMLAQYTRAQLATAGLSTMFYGASMAILSFPHPVLLGFLGGALEFLPMVGWILAATAILISGWLAHANWIWMAGLIVGWRIILNIVVSPRILGNRLQIEPITVFFLLLVGGQIGGILGAVLSVPVAAVLRILWLNRDCQRAGTRRLLGSADTPLRTNQAATSETLRA